MNVNQYIGIPYLAQGRESSGCDCYGLLRILYHDLFKIELPPYYDVEADKAIHSSLILSEQKKWTEVKTPEFGSAICFKIMGYVRHVGMMLNDGNFIHAWRGANSCIENINSIMWRHRVDGFFQHQD